MPFDGPPGSLIVRPAGAIPQGVPWLNRNDPINAGLVARYLLAAAGPCDLSPQGNNGTLNGSSATRPGFAPSRVGPMRSFASASSQYFDCAAATGLPNTGGNLTLAIWAYLTGTTGRQIIFSLVNSESGASYADIEINGTTLSVNGQSSATSGTLPAGSYPGLFLIVYTQRGAANTLYLNGAQLTTNTAGRNPTAPTVIRIASFNSAYPSPYFNGPADNAGVWNRALSFGEVARLWRDPGAGILFPSDRLWTWATASAAGGLSVSAAAALGADVAAALAAGATLPGEGNAGLSRHVTAAPLEGLAAGVAAAAMVAEATAASRRAAGLPGESRAALAPLAGNAPPLEFLAAAAGVAATPAEALAALAAGAIVAIENGGVLSLIVSAAVPLPFEWLVGGTAPIVSAARLLASGGRIRILASPGRRRLLASPGRVRILQITDR
jgi:hypothetical protein